METISATMDNTSAQLRRLTSSFNPAAPSFNPTTSAPLPSGEEVDLKPEEPPPPTMPAHSRMGQNPEAPSTPEPLRRTYYGQVYPSRFAPTASTPSLANQGNAYSISDNQRDLTVTYDSMGHLSRAMEQSLGMSQDESTQPVNKAWRNLAATEWQNLGLKTLSENQSAPARPQDQKVLSPGTLGLDGKLIQRALSKPLTAADLAKHFSRSGMSRGVSMDVSTKSAGPATALSKFPQAPGLTATASEQRAMFPQSEESRFNQANFSALTPQVSGGYLQSSRIPAFDQTVIPIAPRDVRPRAGPSYMRRRNNQRSTKRSDQGPEPSSADIYPEDATLGKRHYPPRPFDTAPPKREAVCVQPSLQVDSAIDWPTPAEVYNEDSVKPYPPPQAATFTPQQIPHGSGLDPAPPIQTQAPTLVACTNELPSRRTQTPTFLLPGGLAVHADNPALICDERPLSPRQVDGSRYGLQAGGIGLGDPWVLKTGGGQVECGGGHVEWKNMRFRLRPLDHSGWGGREWCEQNGWGEQG